MQIPDYILILSPLYQVTRKKNDFKWGPEDLQAFQQIKQGMVHAVGLGPVRAEQVIKICSKPNPRRMVLPVVSGRKHQGRLEVDP